MKIYLSFLVLFVLSMSCTDDRPAANPEDRFTELGHIKQLADDYEIDSIDLTVRCRAPNVSVQYKKLQDDIAGMALPKSGEGCRVEIDAVEVDNNLYVQSKEQDYSWEEGSIVKLVSQFMLESGSLLLKIDGQLPAVISEEDSGNSFVFHVLEVELGDAVNHTTNGTSIFSDESGLTMTTSLLINPMLAHLYYPNQAFIPNSLLQVSLTCQNSAAAKIVNNQLVCGDVTYYDFQIAVVNGIIDLNAMYYNDLCFTNNAQPLSLDKPILSIPRSYIPEHLSMLDTLILRAKNINHSSKKTHQGCYVFPLAPHFAPYVQSKVVASAYPFPFTM